MVWLLSRFYCSKYFIVELYFINYSLRELLKIKVKLRGLVIDM